MVSNFLEEKSAKHNALPLLQPCSYQFFTVEPQFGWHLVSLRKLRRKLKGFIIHYKSLKVVLRDYRQTISTHLIDKETNRLAPLLWAKFSSSSMAMKIFYNNQPENLRNNTFQNTYSKQRSQGPLFGFDDASLKIGSQITKNWISQCLVQFKIA